MQPTDDKASRLPRTCHRSIRANALVELGSNSKVACRSAKEKLMEVITLRRSKVVHWKPEMETLPYHEKRGLERSLNTTPQEKHMH